MQTPRSWVGILLLIIGGAVTPAAAQDRGRTGIVLGYPPSVSVIWHATDRLAVRPEFTFSFSSSEFPSIEGGTDETSSTRVGVGVTALYYLNERDRLRTYVSPRFAYEHSSVELAPSILAVSTLLAVTEPTSSEYSTSGSFGAQYSLSDRFGAFGELGLEYRHQSNKTGLSVGDLHANQWGIRTGVGVILYF